MFSVNKTYKSSKNQFENMMKTFKDSEQYDREVNNLKESFQRVSYNFHILFKLVYIWFKVKWLNLIGYK